MRMHHHILFRNTTAFRQKLLLHLLPGIPVQHAFPVGSCEKQNTLPPGVLSQIPPVRPCCNVRHQDHIAGEVLFCGFKGNGIPERKQGFFPPVDLPALLQQCSSLFILREKDRLGEHKLRIVRPGSKHISSQDISFGPQISKSPSPGKKKHIGFPDQLLQVLLLFSVFSHGDFLYLHLRRKGGQKFLHGFHDLVISQAAVIRCPEQEASGRKDRAFLFSAGVCASRRICRYVLRLCRLFCRRIRGFPFHGLQIQGKDCMGPSGKVFQVTDIFPGRKPGFPCGNGSEEPHLRKQREIRFFFCLLSDMQRRKQDPALFSVPCCRRGKEKPPKKMAEGVPCLPGNLFLLHDCLRNAFRIYSLFGFLQHPVCICPDHVEIDAEFFGAFSGSSVKQIPVRMISQRDFISPEKTELRHLSLMADQCRIGIRVFRKQQDAALSRNRFRFHRLLRQKPSGFRKTGVHFCNPFPQTFHALGKICITAGHDDLCAAS